MPADILPDSCASRQAREYRNWEVWTAMADDREAGRPMSSIDTRIGSPSILFPSQNEASTIDSGSATKRSCNMTETVRVPTSEHVAEIVGRQGCKIKALRAKTNTYIKTPARGEEPVFVVTGRQEDVAKVRHEILSAAEHFSQIRASRRIVPSGDMIRGPAVVSTEHVREKVPVPFWVVGLVVGPKGTTIRRIQQETQTYIITPGKEKEPVFEIVGTTENVARARQEIESYVALRMRSRQNHSALTSSWTKLDNHLNVMCLQQPGNLSSSSHAESSSSLSDPTFMTETGAGLCLPKERNWKQLSGFSSRPLSVDIAEFLRCFPVDENLSLAEKNYLLQIANEKPQRKSWFGSEALISNCLSDLNLTSNGIFESLLNQDSIAHSADLIPYTHPSCKSRMPFVMKPVQADDIDFHEESVAPFHALKPESDI